MQLDLWLKRIWFLIGCLILLMALIAVVIFVVDRFTRHDRGGPLVGANAHPYGQDTLAIQDLTFDFPRPIGRTGLLSVAVYVKDLSAPIPIARSEAGYSVEEGPVRGMVNILFFKSDGSQSHPLLARRAFIKGADISGETDSLQKFNLYDIAFEDTDHDGRLTASDSSQYFISDLDGQRLVPFLDNSSYELVSYRVSTDCKVIYLLLKHRVPNIKPIDWPERLYAFDVATRSLSPLPKDSQVVEQVRRVLYSK